MENPKFVMPYLAILLLNRMEATEICFDCVKKTQNAHEIHNRQLTTYF